MRKSTPGRGNVWRSSLISLLAIFSLANSVLAEFDASGWKHYRNIRIPAEYSSGVAAFALDCAVLEKCRPDLADVRIVASDKSPAQFTIWEAPGEEELNPFPVRVFRTARNAGKWTDIWIDKTGKTLTKGVLLQTGSKDFIRKVEIRGSDNAKEEYIIGMDGLVLDVSSPLQVQSLKLIHPVNNFQYIHLRIIDDDLPPLKIEGVLCYPPSPVNYLSRPLDFRVLEKRTDPAGKSATLVVDLGEKRFPLGNVAIVTSTRDFFAKVALSAANSLNPETWTKFHEGTIFRVQKDESAKEELGMAVKSQLSRYIKIELMNSSKVVPVEKIELAANMRVVVFDYTKGLNYRLYYDNASSAAIPHDDKLLSTNMSRIANATLETSLEEEQKNVAVPTPQKMVVAEPAQSGSWTKVFGIGMLLVGLVLLFVVMLRARSLRKADKHRNSRIVYTRFD